LKRLPEERNAYTVLNLGRYVPALVTLLENRLTNTASAIYRETLGVGATEMRVIVLLGVQSNISGNQIGQAIGVDKAAVSRALKSLEALDLITVTAGHGRRRVVILTPAGRKLHDKGVAISLKREERLLADFSNVEREALIDFLKRMLAQMPAVSAVASEVGPHRVRGKKAPAQQAGAVKRQK
jgi:DNA-binding MarR family transcriptional regulator